MDQCAFLTKFKLFINKTCCASKIDSSEDIWIDGFNLHIANKGAMLFSCVVESSWLYMLWGHLSGQAMFWIVFLRSLTTLWAPKIV